MNKGKEKNSLKKIVILDNIRSVFNVGSIFRTSDGAGVSKIYLCGVTPAPIDRFGRERDDMRKVALGAEKSVTWEICDSTKEAILKVKSEGYDTVAVEQDENSVSYKEFKIKNKTAFIFGEETKGLSKDILKEVDHICEIEMVGEKESLNVSVSAGIILFHFNK